MTARTMLKRTTVVTGAAAALLVAGTTSASAWHCYVPMYSLNGPTSSPNWFVASAELGAAELANFPTLCDEARDAGYAALDDAGLPVGIKIFEKMTIGEGFNLHEYFDEGYMGPTGSGQGAENNPTGADGTGLEYFGAGSTLAQEMVVTYIVGASAVTCGE